MSDTLRLFVALVPEAAARERLALWAQAAFAGRDDVRPLDAQALHLTLAFLGATPAVRADEVAALMLEAVAGMAPAKLTPRAVKALPPRRARLFALDLEDTGGRAAALAEAVAVPLVAAGHHERERRGFWPHLTIARVRRGRRPGAVPAAPEGEPFEAREVVLYRSVLGGGPARYEALARSVLGDDAVPRNRPAT